MCSTPITIFFVFNERIPNQGDVPKGGISELNEGTGTTNSQTQTIEISILADLAEVIPFII